MEAKKSERRRKTENDDSINGADLKDEVTISPLRKTIIDVGGTPVTIPPDPEAEVEPANPRGLASGICLLTCGSLILICSMLLWTPTLILYWVKAYKQEMLTFQLADSSVVPDFTCDLFNIGFGRDSNEFNSCGVDKLDVLPTPSDFSIFDCNSILLFPPVLNLSSALCELSADNDSGQVVESAVKMFNAGMILLIIILAPAVCCGICMGAAFSACGIAASAAKNGGEADGAAIFNGTAGIFLGLGIGFLFAAALPFSLAKVAKRLVDGSSYGIEPEIGIFLQNSVSPSGIYHTLRIQNQMDDFIRTYYTLAMAEMIILGIALLCTLGGSLCASRSGPRLVKAFAVSYV